MNRIRLSLIPLLVGACGFPSERRVADEFQRDHPTYRVIDVAVGEGDASAAYYTIRYLRPGDAAEHREEWLYLDRGDGRKVLTRRE